MSPENLKGCEWSHRTLMTEPGRVSVLVSVPLSATQGCWCSFCIYHNIGTEIESKLAENFPAVWHCRNVQEIDLISSNSLSWTLQKYCSKQIGKEKETGVLPQLGCCILSLSNSTWRNWFCWSIRVRQPETGTCYLYRPYFSDRKMHLVLEEKNREKILKQKMW